MQTSYRVVPLPSSDAVGIVVCDSPLLLRGEGRGGVVGRKKQRWEGAMIIQVCACVFFDLLEVYI